MAKPRGGAKFTVREYESICHNRYRTGGIIPAVHLVAQARSRPKVLQIPVQRVCKVDILALGVNHHIVHRAELSTKVIVENDGGVVWFHRVHDNKFRSVVCTSALSHVDDLAPVVRCAVRIDNGGVGGNDGDVHLASGIGLGGHSIGLRKRDLLDDG